MCGLFGFMKTSNDNKTYKNLLNALAQYSSERGTHATGISYNNNGRLITYKKPLSAYKMNLEHFDNVRTIIGHTRHATQGKPELNYNNHPFMGIADVRFALAHNGVLYNDTELRYMKQLPQHKITTDSYIMVQLIERAKRLTVDNLVKSVELLEGSYTFTILDELDNLYIIKGDNPIHAVRLTKLNLIVYASTEEILYKSILDARLFHHITNKDFDIIPIVTGDIIKVTKNGEISYHRFTPKQTRVYKNWYDFTTFSQYDFTTKTEPDDDTAFYISELKTFASIQGFDPEIVDNLLDDGFTLDDIENYLYEMETWSVYQ